MVFIICFIFWFILGVSGFIFWWTAQHNLTIGELMFSVLPGITLGPFAWIVGYFIHGDRSKILIEKRKK